jgi:hypothetical protein
MALEGTLQDFALVDILQLIGMQRKTGVLALTRKDETINVVVQDGMVVWAAPPDETFEADLGRLLIRRELITRARWDEVRQMRARKGQRLVSFLLEGQWISPRDVEKVVQRLVLETLYRALRWRDGQYTFAAQAQVDLSRGQIPPVGTETLLLEAVRQMDEWPMIERRIPSLDLVVRRSDRPAYRDQAPPEALTVLQLVDGRRSAREIAELCDLGEFDAYKGIADLLAAGALQLEQRSDAGAGEFRPAQVPRRLRMRLYLPSWVAPGAAAAVAVAFLVLLFRASDDPLRLFPSSPLAAEAEVQTRRLTLAGRELPRALDEYLLLHLGYPNSLAELRTEGLYAGDLQDPWGRAWIYEPRQSTYRLASPGLDGRIGTADDLQITPPWPAD